MSYWPISPLNGLKDVWTGKNTSTGEPVIIKFFDRENEYAYSEHNEAIKREVDILKELSLAMPDRVVRFIDFYADDENRYVLVMERGECTLLDVLMEKEYFPEDEARVVIRETLLAVAGFHQHMKVYRDIKPANILLMNRSDLTSIKFCDFGTCTSEFGYSSQNLTVGTLYYMAPEVLKPKEFYGWAADIWSLGVLTYQLLLGDIPFLPPKSKESAMLSIIRKSVLSFTNKRGVVLSPEAQDFVRLLLSFEPEKRPTAAAALNHPWLSQGLPKQSVFPVAGVPGWISVHQEDGLVFFVNQNTNETFWQLPAEIEALAQQALGVAAQDPSSLAVPPPLPQRPGHAASSPHSDSRSPRVHFAEMVRVIETEAFDETEDDDDDDEADYDEDEPNDQTEPQMESSAESQPCDAAEEDEEIASYGKFGRPSSPTPVHHAGDHTHSHDQEALFDDSADGPPLPPKEASASDAQLDPLSLQTPSKAESGSAEPALSGAESQARSPPYPHSDHGHPQTVAPPAVDVPIANGSQVTAAEVTRAVPNQIVEQVADPQAEAAAGMVLNANPQATTAAVATGVAPGSLAAAPAEVPVAPLRISSATAPVVVVDAPSVTSSLPSPGASVPAHGAAVTGPNAGSFAVPVTSNADAGQDLPASDSTHPPQEPPHQAEAAESTPSTIPPHVEMASTDLPRVDSGLRSSGKRKPAPLLAEISSNTLRNVAERIVLLTRTKSQEPHDRNHAHHPDRHGSY
ncbi:kinase-like domain-containing protein [Polychytrium aggregatum]|uniref:kinase-like domain-containing protein n=1 Tax=Polychytrium aggregatum TaxID=110093 RepID=UPI0022FDC0B7|nr:kinase-like domain-containing protein [Polychytrium aggregatum]KAI9199818.1 kinase-like domain-containing protein [Polychytrium aggregatum]